MLTPKMIKKRKLYIYLAIVGLMFLGTLFFIYKNYELSGGNFFPARGSATVSKSESISIDHINNNDVDNKNKALEDDLNNLGFIKKEQFKDLINSSVVAPEIKSGNKNPFQPYE